MLPLTTEVALVKSAVGHLQTVLNEEPEKLAMGLTSLAWLRLPGDEAAAIERACDFALGRCEHGFISRCEERECRHRVDAIYRDWAAEQEIARMEAEIEDREDYA